MDEILKKCPFCNGHPVMITGTRDGRRTVKFIECSSCQAHGEKFEDKFPDIPEQKAIESWNRRKFYEAQTQIILRYGFDAAIELVKSVFDNSPEKENEELWEEIEEEIELYKKDG